MMIKAASFLMLPVFCLGYIAGWIFIPFLSGLLCATGHIDCLAEKEEKRNE